MNILNSDFDPDDFFPRLRDAPHRLLMLDYDGTLAPFTPTRGEARPYPALLPVLRELFAHPGCRTVIISGRSVDDIRALLPEASRTEIWGSHGWERRFPDGRYLPPSLGVPAAQTIEKEWEWLTALFPASQIECKPASIALHWRGYEQTDQIMMRALSRKRWRRLLDESSVELHGFDGGIELRARGRSKGDAVRALLGEYSSSPAAAYLGDDRTDEDAFVALGAKGLRVLVRETPRETAADLHLRPPEELLWFLEQWREHL